MKGKFIFFFIILFNLLIAQSDCDSAIMLCGNSSVHYTANGFGNTNEALSGCVNNGEHHSRWYKFTIERGGTLTFDLSPMDDTDYNWAIYGPYRTCSNLGFPVRCNASRELGNTGMDFASSNTSAQINSTNTYSRFMDVVAGESYYLYIDNVTPTTNGFRLNWGGTARFVDPFTNTTTHTNPFLPPDGLLINANNTTELYICSETATYDFSTLSAVILNGNSNFDVRYYYTPNDAVTGNNPITTPITINTSSIYYYSISYTGGTYGGGCKKMGSFKFVNRPPSISITSTTNFSVCAGTTTTTLEPFISGGTGFTYSWSNGATTPSITVNTGGVYTLTITNSTGCIISESAVVTETPVPVVQNSSLTACSLSPTARFNLRTAENQICPTPSVNFRFYDNYNDANIGNNNFIVDPTNFLSGSTIIYVRVYQDQCYKVAELQLNINPKPTPTITASSLNICNNNPITLTSSLNNGNIWSTGETTSSISITSAGTYSLINNNGVCSSDPVYITINNSQNPDTQISGNLSYCEGSSTILTALGTGNGLIYTWSTGATTPTITVNTPGVYSVTTTTQDGCSFIKSVTVTENPIPVTNNISISVCSDNATSLFDLVSMQNQISTSPGITFSYYTNLLDATAGNNNTISNPTNYIIGTTIIYVRVSNGSCSRIAEINITVESKPHPTIHSSSNLVCNNQPVTLTSNLANGNLWSTGQNTQSITVTTPGTYTLTNTNNGCVSDVISITLTGDSDPNTQISGNLSICDGSSTALTATTTSTGNTFSWSNGSIGNTTTITSAGTYIVTTTTPSGCQFQTSVNVTMEPPILIRILPPLEINCTNTIITLDATGSTFPPGSTFLWTTVGGNIISGSNTLTPTVNEAGTYTLTINSNSSLGCSKQLTVTVIKNITIPSIGLSSSSLIICEGDSVILTATGANIYTWTGLAGNGNSQVVNPLTTTTYSVTGIGANGCIAQNTASLTITVLPKITSPLHNITICKGEIAILDAGQHPDYTYLWNTGETTSSITTSNEGQYSVTINNGGCTRTINISVSYINTPLIKNIIYQNNTLTIQVENPDNYLLEYSIDNGLTWQPSNIFANIQRNTNYPIRVRKRGENCDNGLNYYTLHISNVITPNNDGLNDIIDFSNLIKADNFDGQIFDKYGKVIFKATPTTPIWDGKYIGRPLPTDTYWYTIRWNDFVSKQPILTSGWILLKNRE